MINVTFIQSRFIQFFLNEFANHHCHKIFLLSGNIPGLCWENKEQTIFRMPWKHAGRQDYNLEEDSKIFMVSMAYRETIKLDFRI